MTMCKIGLVLGGGGAKGYAHIGVLRALEQLGIYADIITGTSMGGLIGGLYAAGLSVDRIELIVRQTGLTVLAAREPNHLGMFGKTKLIQVLRNVLGDVKFEQLSRKFAVVAVDLEAETEVILDTGDIVEALLATSAFPGLFAPERRDGRYLIDGGALNNIPFDVARHLGADYVIGVDLMQPHLRRRVGPFRFGAMALETLIQRSGGGLDAADCLITPSLAGFNSLRFGQAEYLIGVGEVAARQQLDTILKALRAPLPQDSALPVFDTPVWIA